MIAKRWTPEKLQLLRENRHLANEKLAEMLHTTVANIKWLKHKHKIYTDHEKKNNI